MKIIWIIGGPGCGKGTQCKRIIEKYGFYHISSGDLLREEVARGSARDAFLQETMSKGLFVSTDIVLDLIKERMQKIKQEKKTEAGFLIDGYPRELGQALLFEKNVCPVDLIIFFDASNEVLEKRLLGRAEILNRVDDNEETIKNRIKLFNMNRHIEIINHYKEKVVNIDANGNADEIFNEVSKLILSRTTIKNVNECRKFASNKKALAFNYGIENNDEFNIGIHNRNKSLRKICQALQCPEIYNFTTLVQDKNYKYYSMYPSVIPIGSSFILACIPRTGIFAFSSNNLNYSQAQISCQKINASLTHIISEERTNGLAKYISLDTPTFVGLSNYNNEKIWKNEFGESLSCFNYRAWGRGQPSHSVGCVTLVSSKFGPFWKIVPCDSILTFICEISPMYRYLHN